MKKIFLVGFMVWMVFFRGSPSFCEKRFSDTETPQGLKAYNSQGEAVGVVKKIDRKLVFFDADAVTFKKHDKNEWGIYNVKNASVGTLIRKNDHLALMDEKERFTGFLLYTQDRGLKKRKRFRSEETELKNEFKFLSTVTNILRIKPESARLYDRVMNALK